MDRLLGSRVQPGPARGREAPGERRTSRAGAGQGVPFVYPVARRQEETAIAYRIEKGDYGVVDALRRIAAEEVEGALAAVEGGSDIGERIHEVRRHTKKLRGLLRLVRPAFPDYETENAHFRDLARSIAGARDADVTATTLERLIASHDVALAEAAFSELRREIAAGRPATPHLAPVRQALCRARERIKLWTLHETGWDALAGGLGKTYRRASKRQNACGDEALHAWRKPIKYHWYHVRLLREIDPEQMGARAETADAMGGLLGLHQDRAVLERQVKRSALPMDPRRVLRGVIAQRKAELEAEARDLGPRLLADKPKALVAHWGELWEAWRG